MGQICSIILLPDRNGVGLCLNGCKRDGIDAYPIGCQSSTYDLVNITVPALVAE